MKRILGILLLSLFAFTACNDDSSILEPSFETTESSLEKGRVILPLGGRGLNDDPVALDGFAADDDKLNNDGF